MSLRVELYYVRAEPSFSYSEKTELRAEPSWARQKTSSFEPIRAAQNKQRAEPSFELLKARSGPNIHINAISIAYAMSKGGKVVQK